MARPSPGGPGISGVLLAGLWIVCLLDPVPVAQGVELNIAWLASDPLIYFFNASNSVGALVYAIQEIEADPTRLPGYTFNVRWKDSACDSRQAVGKTFEFFEDPSFSPDLLLGPICSGAMAPVAQLGSYKNLPVFGWITSDPILEDKTVYDTLVRLLWPIANIGEGIIILCDKFLWKRVAIISSEGGDFGELGKGVRKVFQSKRDDGFVISRWVADVELSPTQDRIREVYDLVKDEARIIVLCVPLEEVRNWSLAAFDSDMHSGHYVFIYTNQQTPTRDMVSLITSPQLYVTGGPRDGDVRAALESFFLVFARTLDFNVTDQYLDDFYSAALTDSWPTRLLPPSRPNIYSLFLYDALKVYARVATETATVNDGKRIFNQARSTVTVGGATGDIILSDTNDRNPDYWVFDLQANGVFVIVGSTVSFKNGSDLQRNLIVDLPIRWGDGSVGDTNAPPDVPACGFEGELCPNLVLYIVPAVVTLVVILAVIACVLVCRKIKYERDLTDLVWKVNYEELKIYTGVRGPGSQLNLRSMSMSLKKSKASVADSLAGEQLYITVANFRGMQVAVKTVRKDRVKLERELLQEMRQMIELKHYNVNTLIGACIEEPTVCCLWEYGPKGSLQDAIWNDNITLDDTFKFSLVVDVLKGLQYLHDSSLKVHGRLKSSNVIVDGRFTAKLTDYGAEVFTRGERPDPDQSEHAKYTKLQWTPPETLRQVASQSEEEGGGAGGEPPSYRYHHPQGDIYAAGVIMKEVFCRNGPYTERDTLEPKEIIGMVMKPDDSGKVFRPDLSELAGSVEVNADAARQLCDVIQRCWAEEPDERPSAGSALKACSRINPSKTANIVESVIAVIGSYNCLYYGTANVVDNVIAVMEKYTKQMEAHVAERTVQLREEKKKTEALLFKMLPQAIAEDLKHGKEVETETFEEVSIYFSDIPGFAALAANCTPFKVVDILNGVYSLMDGIIVRHDVYKVETVGDVYVMVSGLPTKNGSRHIVETVNCALDLVSGIMAFRIDGMPDYQLKIRIGINSGSIVTGVVGLAMPRYCLFGDTMNTASRMESNGKPLCIHISQTAYRALAGFTGYHVAERGEIPVKGKGMMMTYWILGRDGFHQPLPNYDAIFKSDHPAPKRLPVTKGRVVNPKVLRPSTESGFSEGSDIRAPDSRKTSTTSASASASATHPPRSPPPREEIVPDPRQLTPVEVRSSPGLTTISHAW